MEQLKDPTRAYGMAVRRAAERQGLRLSKSRAQTGPDAQSWRLAKATTGAWVGPRFATLADVEDYLAEASK